MIGQLALDGTVAAVQEAPLYRCAVQCRTCGQVIGYFSPHAHSAHAPMHAAVREHRTARGCPDKVSPFVLTRCSLCQDILPTVVTLSLNGGAYWRTVGHPHDAVHGVDRHRRAAAEIPDGAA